MSTDKFSYKDVKPDSALAAHLASLVGERAGQATVAAAANHFDIFDGLEKLVNEVEKPAEGDIVKAHEDGKFTICAYESNGDRISGRCDKIVPSWGVSADQLKEWNTKQGIADKVVSR